MGTDLARAIERINQAFLQFSYVIKNMCYFELDPPEIDKARFDTKIELKDIETTLPENEFKRYEDLVLAAQNEVIICLGFTTLVLEEAYKHINKSKLNDNEKDIVELLYMIRCAFAHPTLSPVWKIAQKYRKQYKIVTSDGRVDVDLTEKDGKPFQPEDISGYRTYFRLKDFIIKLLNTKGDGIIS